MKILNFKKGICLGLAVVMLLALIGCGNKSANKSTSTTTQAQ